MLPIGFWGANNGCSVGIPEDWQMGVLEISLIIGL
jgi:hypothetical protein